MNKNSKEVREWVFEKNLPSGKAVGTASAKALKRDTPGMFEQH